MKFASKAVLWSILALSLIAVIVGCSKSVPDELASAKERRFDGVRGVGYCEVWLIGGNPITKNLKGAVYNTTTLNDQASPMQSCPADMWAKVDPETLKKQYDVLAVFKNGPRGWVNDWIQLPVAQNVTTFDGLQTHWFMTVELPKDIEVGKKGGTAYKPTIGHRNSEMGFTKGKAVFILDDPDGNPWVMQAYSQIVDPNLTFDQLAKLGERLKLAPGWKFRVAMLDRDLSIKAINGDAWIVQDELENTYDKCFEANGQAACTYKP